VSLRLVD